MSNLDKIRAVISEELGIGEADIQICSSLSDLGADSLHKASLMLELENELGIEITDDEAVKLFTVKDVLDYVDQRSVRV